MVSSTIPDEPPYNKESKKWKKVELSRLEQGDHICWWCTEDDETILHTPYWRHALLVEISPKVLTVIGWKFKPDSRTKEHKPEIVQDETDLAGKTISRATYKDKCYTIEEVLFRAREHLGDTDYHVVYNYARAFPRYCKTGYGGFTFIQPKKRPPEMVKTDIAKIEKGDHIRFWNKIYWKHAIVSEEWIKGKVKIISWRLFPGKEIIEEDVEFSAGSKVYKAIYNKVARFSAGEIVKRAKSRIKETAYNVITNYARAFPRWCVTGYGGIATE